jgi:3-oxoacyl-[acyl-carrier protein] reductase
VTLDGRTALVTGAGSGIGRATALALARAGARVVCQDIDGDGAAATATDVRAEGVEAQEHACDVADAAGIGAMFTSLDDADWTVDVLFSCAGVDKTPGDGFDEAMAGGGPQIALMSDDAWKRMLDIHLDGAFRCTRDVVRRLVAAGRPGALIYVSSIAGTAGWGPAHYATAKGGLLGLTRALARELGPHQIRANAICPGVIDTPMVRNLDAGMIAGLQMLTPLGRMGTVDDIASLAVFLAGADSGFVTGQAISPNGGLVIS